MDELNTNLTIPTNNSNVSDNNNNGNSNINNNSNNTLGSILSETDPIPTKPFKTYEELGNIPNVDPINPLTTKADGVISKSFTKQRNTALSIEEKANILNKSIVKKQTSFEGFKPTTLNVSDDADTFRVFDKVGNETKHRIKDSTINSYIDAVEIPHYGEGSKGQAEHATNIIKSLVSTLDAQAKYVTLNGGLLRSGKEEQNLALNTRNQAVDRLLNNLDTNTLTEEEIASMRQIGFILPDSIKNKISNNINERIKRNEDLFKADKWLKSLASKSSTNNQLKFVADLLNKGYNEITPSDVIQAGKYQQYAMLDILTAKEVKEIPKFNPNIDYNKAVKTIDTSNIEVLYKSFGKDNYGRELVEYINPNTGQNASSTFSRNPNLNVSLNVYDHLDTQQNRDNQEKEKFHNQYMEALKELSDTDSYGGELVDAMQSSFLQAGVNIASFLLPDKAVETIDKTLTKNGKATLTDLVDPDTGKAILDQIAGVKKSTRDTYNKNLEEAADKFVAGNYLDAIKQAIGSLPMLIADSSASTGIIVGSLATAGLGTTVGLGALGAKVITGTGIALASADLVERNAKQFEKNNEGLSYSPQQYALDLTLQAALLIPEAILIKTGVLDFVKKPLLEALKRIPDRTIFPKAFQALVVAMFGEGIQESLEGIKETAMTQKVTEKKPLTEIIKDPKIWFEGMLGALAGGAITGIAISPSVAVETVNKLRNKKEIAVNDKRKKDVTIYGEKADPELHKSFSERIKELDIKKQQVEKNQKDIDELFGYAVKNTEEVSFKTFEDLTSKQIENEIKKITQGDIDLSDEVDRQELLKKTIYHYKAFDRRSNNSNIAKEKTLEIGKKLGFTEEETQKTFKEVEYDASFGEAGYYTYQNIINITDKIIKTDPNLSTEQTQKMIKYKADALSNLKHFRNTQIHKINAFTSAVERLNSMDSARTTKIGKFEITKDDVLSSNYEEGKRLYSVVKAAVRNIESMNKILEPHDINIEDYKDNYKKALDDFIKVTDSIKDLRKQNVPIVEKEYDYTKDDMRKIYKAVRNRLKEPKNSLYAKQYRDTLIKYGKDNIEKTIKLMEGLPDSNKLYKDIIKTLKQEVKAINEKEQRDIKRKKEEEQKRIEDELEQKRLEEEKLHKEGQEELEVTQRELGIHPDQQEETVIEEKEDDPMKDVIVEILPDDKVADEVTAHLNNSKNIEPKKEVKSKTKKEPKIKKEIKPKTKKEPKPKKIIKPTIFKIKGREIDLTTENAIKNLPSKINSINSGKPLTKGLSKRIQNIYKAYLPTNLELKPTKPISLNTKNNIHLANEYNEIVISDQGAYIELTENQIIPKFLDDKPIASNNNTDVYRLNKTQNIIFNKNENNPFNFKSNYYYISIHDINTNEEVTVNTSPEASELIVSEVTKNIDEIPKEELKTIIDNSKNNKRKSINIEDDNDIPIDTSEESFLEDIAYQTNEYEETSLTDTDLENYADNIAIEEYQDDTDIPISEKIETSINQVFSLFTVNEQEEIQKLNNEGLENIILLNKNKEEYFIEVEKNNQDIQLYQEGIKDYKKELRKLKRHPFKNKEQILEVEEKLKALTKLNQDTIRLNDSIYINKIYKVEQLVAKKSASFKNDHAQKLLDTNKLLSVNLKPLTKAQKAKGDKPKRITSLKKIIKASDKVRNLLGQFAVNPNNEGIKKVIADMNNIFDNNTNLFAFRLTNNNRALGIMYENNGTEQVLNPNAAFAMDLAVKTLVSTEAHRLKTKSFTDFKHQVKGLFPRYDTVTYQYYETFKKHGVYRVSIADSLGQNILKTLGFEAKTDTASSEEYRTLVTNLGNMALVYAEGKGYITDTAIDFSEETDRLETKIKDVITFHLVKSSITEKQKVAFTKHVQRFEALTIEDDTKIEPLPFPAKQTEVTKIRKTNKIFKAYDKANETLNKLRKVKFLVNKEAVEWIKENPELIKKHMGYVTNFDNMLYEEVESAKAQNANIEKEINDLIELSNKGKQGGWFFQWFFSVNGRYFIDSKTVDPQKSKLHRFLFTPVQKREHRTIFLDKKNSTDMFKYALAQGFGFSVDSKTDEDRNAFINPILETPAEIIEEAFKTDTLNELNLGLEVENVGHFITAIQTLEEYQDAILNQRKSFTTSIVAEYDSTTSGSVIKLLQAPFKELYPLLEKVGIQFVKKNEEAKTIHNLKGSKGFNDIYKTIAAKFKMISFEDFYQHILDVSSEASKEEFIQKQGKPYVLLNNSKENIEIIFNLLKTLFPKVADNGIVSKELRTLFKDPTMTFNYGSGLEAVSTNLGEKLTYELTRNYLTYMETSDKTQLLKDKSQEYYDNLIKLFTPFEKKIPNFREKLKTQPYENIVLGTTTTGYTYYLKEFLVEVIKQSYGRSVYQTLEDTFKPFLFVNYFLNNAFTFMFKAFELKYNNAIARVIKQKGKITIEEEDTILEANLKYFPMVQSVFSSMDKKGVSIDSVNIISDTYTLSEDSDKNKTEAYFNKELPVFKAKGTKSISLRTRMKQFSAALNSGAVVPIHYIDGSLITMTLQDFIVMAIHDAVIPAIGQGNQVIKGYNTNLYSINKDYNLFEEVYERLQDIIEDLNYFDKKNMNLIIPNYLAIFKYDFNSADVYTNVEYFLEGMKLANNRIKKERENFYKQEKNIAISNVDGLQDSIFYGRELSKANKVKVEKATNEIVKKASHILGSGPISFTKEVDVSLLTEGALTDPKIRLEVMDKLHAINPTITNKPHLDYLKELVGSIDGTNLANIKAFLNDNTDAVASIFDIKKSRIMVGVTEDYHNRKLKQNSSAVEMYAHETLHAVVHEVLFNSKWYNKNREIRELLNLQEVASKYITYKDFLPNKKYISKKDEDIAQQTYNYIFNNPEVKAYHGLNEFIAFGLTNERFMEKLKTIPIKAVKEHNKTFLDFLVNTAKKLIDAFLNSDFMSNILPNLTSSIIDPRKPNDSDIVASLYRLTSSLASANNSAMQKVETNNIFKGMEGTLNFLSDKVRSLNEKLNLRRLTHIGDKWNIKMETENFEEVLAKEFIRLLKFFILAPVNEEARKRIPLVLRDLGLRHEGVIQSTIRDISEPDENSSSLEKLSLLSRKTEQLSKQLEGTAYVNLKTAFEKELTDNEKNALTKGLIKTDVQVFLGDLNISQIKELYSNADKRTAYIKRLENKLRKENTVPISNWYINQSKLLAEFMLTSKGSEVTLLNAHNIATGVLLQNPIKASQETINTIDKLTSLYAIEKLEFDVRETIVDLDNIGVDNYITAHKQFVKDTLDENKVNRYHMVKGYSKQLLDYSYDFQVLPTSMELEMDKKGYALVKVFKTNKVTGKSGFGLYRTKFKDLRNRNGSSFMYLGQHAMGTTLDEITNENIDDYNKRQTMFKTIRKRYIEKANSLGTQLIHKLQNKKDVDIDEIIEDSSRFIPILDTYGQVSNYRLTMDNETKEQFMDVNLNGLTVLSRMYASQQLKYTIKQQNNRLFKFLLEDHKKYMEDKENKTDLNIKTYKKYVTISETNSDPKLQEIFNILPDDIKDYIRNPKNDPFKVREDWLSMLFGIKEISLIDAPLMQYAPIELKKLVKLAESIMKFVASIYKVNVIIRTPVVLISNIVSNINIGLAEGFSLTDIIKKYIENFINVRDYAVNKRKLNNILFKQHIGKATKEEISKINWYRTVLDANPVHELASMGMYQPIIEDLTSEDIGAMGKADKWIQKKTKNLPKPVKIAIKYLYLSEDTAFYKFMFTATQYSDFVARLTEYQLRMRNAPNPTKEPEEYRKFDSNTKTKILNTYINYDKPLSAIEQYLNDMGLMIFTKFFKRIQHVIFKGMLDNPVSTALFLMLQISLFDTDDIYEQHMLVKPVTTALQNPLETLMNVITPSTIRLANGLLN